MSETRYDDLNKGRRKKYVRNKDFRHNKNGGYEEFHDSSLRFKEQKKRQNNWKNKILIDEEDDR